VPLGTIWSNGAAVAAVGGGALVLAWQDAQHGTMKVTYAASSSSASSIDPSALAYPLALAPLVHLDAHGHALLAWMELLQSEAVAGEPGGLRGPVTHVFYARYAPGSGWTSPTQIDGDDGTGRGGFLFAGFRPQGFNAMVCSVCPGMFASIVWPPIVIS
jgi:hypothetical protein